MMLHSRYGAYFYSGLTFLGPGRGENQQDGKQDETESKGFHLGPAKPNDGIGRRNEKGE